jgi:hypothetical protein
MLALEVPRTVGIKVGMCIVKMHKGWHVHSEDA